MTAFAENTSVPVERSKAEIERMLSRYGADQFASGWRDSFASVMFRAQGRFVRFELRMPSRTDKRFTHGESRHRPPQPVKLSDDEAYKRWEGECRRLWRALCLVVKAKLEAVTSGISTFEEEFLAHLVLPDGGTVGRWLLPQIETAYASGKMPLALPMLPAPEVPRG